MSVIQLEPDLSDLERDVVPSVTKALQLLDTFRTHGPTLGVSQISRCGVPKSTAFRLLAYLEQSGFVERTAAAAWTPTLRARQQRGALPARRAARDRRSPPDRPLRRHVREPRFTWRSSRTPQWSTSRRSPARARCGCRRASEVG